MVRKRSLTLKRDRARLPWLAMGGLGCFLFLGLFSCVIQPLPLTGYPCLPEGAKMRCAQGERCDEDSNLCIPLNDPGPPCQTDVDCKQPKICESLFCVSPACVTDASCPSRFCDRGRCKPCTQDDDCQGICNNGVCEENQCTSAADCPSRFCERGRCKPCTEDAQCPGICNKETGICEGCLSNDECETRLCKNGQCSACTTNTECAPGRCQDNRCENQCSQDSECSSNFCKAGVCATCQRLEDCASLRCSEGRCLSPCLNDGDCTNGRFCKAGKCQLPQEGEICLDIPSAGCADKLICFATSGQNRCRKPCNPTQEMPCDPERICQYIPASLPQNAIGLCLPPSTNPSREGELCNNNDFSCVAKMYCRNQGQESRCRKLCQLQQQQSCDATEECVTLNDPT